MTKTKSPARVFAVVFMVAVTTIAHAELCTIDNVPAATLLLPYFEVGLTAVEDDPVESEFAVDTLFAINNASAAPTVAHVVLWGDWSLPSIDFDIFLTGYDLETVSLSQVFNSGNLPITAHATNDPNDLISPHGRLLDNPGDGSGPHPGLSENPQWDSFPDGPANPVFPGCDTNLPLGENPVLSGSFLDRVRCGHTGRGLACEEQQCIGQVHERIEGVNDYVARGYVTFDNVTDCNLLFPGQVGYFGTGLTNETNQLWGDWFLVKDGRAIGDALVAIEAYNEDQYDGQQFDPDDYTFYGRFVDGLATDQREPLGSSWATRYFNLGAGLFGGSSSLFVWRDSKCRINTAGGSGADGCRPTAGTPAWWPLDETQVVAFDLQEDATEICETVPGVPGGGGVSPPPPDTPPEGQFCFPIETGRYRVGEGELIPPYEFGWLYLNLNFSLGDTSGSPTPCSADGLFGDIGQSWVTSELDAKEGRLSVGFPSTQLTSACTDANPVVVGNLGE